MGATGAAEGPRREAVAAGARGEGALEAAAAPLDLAAAFQRLGARLGGEGAAGRWEVRFETPPAAYLHLSKPGWGDQDMDGVHLEAYYAAGGEAKEGKAVVALHCEAGAPGGDRCALMADLAERIAPEVAAWPPPGGGAVGAWGPLLPCGTEGCTVLEWRAALPNQAAASTVMEHIETRLAHLRRTLTPHVDAAIAAALL